MRSGTRVTVTKISLAVASLAALTGCVSASSAIIVEADIAAPTENHAEISTSPLDEYLGLVFGLGFSPAEFRRIIEMQNVREEELIATCMADQGFDYILYLDRNPLPAVDGEPWLRDDTEWVSKWGYGMFKTDPEPGSFPVQAATWGVIQETDPNFALVSSMTSAERSAWEGAFFGQWPEPGCFDTAWQNAMDGTPQSILETVEFAWLWGAWFELQSQLHSPISADQDWAACMADAGIAGLSRQQDAWEMVNAMIFNTPPHIGIISPGWNWFADIEMSDLERLRAFEVEIAQRDLACRIAVDYENRRASFVHELETQFVSDNKQELEALRDAAEQRGVNWLDD